jgi:hypothetical protein
MYSAHRYVTLWRWARRREVVLPSVSPEHAPLPIVTLQLPLYNERLVVERLIDAAVAMDYPSERLQVQVLDDSTDETTVLATAAVARYRARGIDIEMLHREQRDGFKAGALAAGLTRARGEIIVIFDADFVPGPDFIKRIVPPFIDPRVGVVQARWGHLNRNRSMLTAAQATMLDAHFLLEHEARMRTGLFFNFNGTAGAWRRACIDASGGWMHDTLTEDLDLSYRAQLLGWRFVSLPTVVAPAELPADVDALKSQQYRWAKGSIQTARKLLPAVLRSGQPLPVKIEAFFHLTGICAYPLLLLSGLLLWPVLVSTPDAAPRVAAALDLSVILGGLVPVAVFLVAGQLAVGARGWIIARDVVAVLAFGAGLSVNNAWAVLRGFERQVGSWDRTPKIGDGGGRASIGRYVPRRSRSGWLELLLGTHFAALSILALIEGRPLSVPFLVLLAFGLVYVGGLSAKRRCEQSPLLRVARPRTMILGLLRKGPRTAEPIAADVGQSVANTSRF